LRAASPVTEDAALVVARLRRLSREVDRALGGLARPRQGEASPEPGDGAPVLARPVGLPHLESAGGAALHQQARAEGKPGLDGSPRLAAREGPGDVLEERVAAQLQGA